IIEQGLHLPVLPYRRCLGDQFLPTGAQFGQRAGPFCRCPYLTDALPGGAERGFEEIRAGDPPERRVVSDRPPARLRGTKLIEQAGKGGLPLPPPEGCRGGQRRRRPGGSRSRPAANSHACSWVGSSASNPPSVRTALTARRYPAGSALEAGERCS